MIFGFERSNPKHLVMADTRLGEKFARAVRDEAFRPIVEWLKREHQIETTVEELAKVVGAPTGGPVLPSLRSSSTVNGLVTNGLGGSRNRKKNPKQEENPPRNPEKYEWRYVPLPDTIPCEYVGRMKDYKGYKCGKPCVENEDGCSQHKGKVKQNSSRSTGENGAEIRVQLSANPAPLNVPNLAPVSAMPIFPTSTDGLDLDPVEYTVDGKTIEYTKERTQGFALDPDNKVVGVFTPDNKTITPLTEDQRKTAQDMGLDL